jgi:hypothetical protein
VGARTRSTFITAALDAGVPLRDVQEAASHADPRTTMRYDRARTSLDLWVPKTCATWADACGTPSARSCERCLEGGLVRACDDLRLVGLKLIFLITTRAVSVLGLSRREAWWDQIRREAKKLPKRSGWGSA